MAKASLGQVQADGSRPVGGHYEPMPIGEDNYGKAEKTEKTTDPKLWDKPRKFTIFLIPMYRKPTN